MFLLCAPTHAAPVVWATPPNEQQQALVDALPGSEPSTTLQDLALQAAGPVDPEGRQMQLASTLESVRAYETRLDGERIIMDDLQGAIDRIQIIRSQADAERLFRALAYQGFAVHRFFGDGLEDDEATPWRAEVERVRIPRPWRDAVALDPEHEVTAYDIAEAPQRVAFTAARSALSNVLPGGLRIDADLEGTVFLDGKPLEVSSSTVRVPPGRHYLHRVLDDQIVAYGSVTVGPGGTEAVELPLPKGPDLDLAELQAGGPVPPDLQPLLQAAGGELWVAIPEDPGVQVLILTSEGVRSTHARPPDVEPNAPQGDGLYLVGSLGVGWFTSGDFYTQAPKTAPHSKATVNTSTLGGGLGAGVQLGLFRAEAGLDAFYTPGANHTALSGDGGFRLRPTPYAAVGIPWLMASGGFILPYHPFVGARAALPLPRGFELRGDFRAGFPGSLQRDDGSSYTTLPVYALSAAVAFRVGPGAR